MSTVINKITSTNNILTGSAFPLVVTRNMVRNFGSSEDYVEMHLSDPSGRVSFSIVPFKDYIIPGGFQPSTTYTIKELVFDPGKDLENLGIKFGNYNVTYNILRPIIVKSYNPSLFIKEISGDRKEIRLSTNNIPNSELIQNTNEFIQNFSGTPYFKEFYLNFGKNRLIPAVNIALDLGGSTTTVVGPTGNQTVTSSLSGPPTVLIKLLNPLPVNYKVNDLLTVIDEISNPQKFEAIITPDPVPTVFPTLRGANFDLDLDNLRVGPTPYYNFTQVTTFQGTFAPQLQQLLGQLSASNFAINVDYTDFEEFVHFSSAARRLEGFQYKLTQIEVTSSMSASAALSVSPTAQLDATKYQNSINKVIQSFDGWEQYMYYESESYAWPKQNSTKPYINYSVTSSQGVNWYANYNTSASLYDDNNQNYLMYAMPGYITENTDNELVFQFVASIGQMFDDVWIHIKAISDLYQAKNSLTEGISKDLVYFALQSMGIDVYTDQDGNNVFQYLYGVDANGNYLPQTGSYDTLVSASQYQIPGQDQQKGIYKRLYHNLPLLLKSKGTTRFIQYLNTIFGVPDTVMSYLEYGGVDKVTSSFEYEYDRFTYALNVSGSNTVRVPWTYTSQSAVRTGNTDIAPNGIEFRFKAYPTSSFATQSLFYSGSDIQFNLLYAATASNNSIYSGSTGEFGYFQFKLGGLSVTSSTIPVYYTGSNSDSDNDTDWYTVLIQRTNPDLRIGQTSTSQTYQFFVKNNVWGEIGHKTSASLTTNTAASNSLWYSQGAMTFGGGSNPFSGSLQELRLWSNHVSESTFDSHVLNPESIEGNTYSSSFSDLTARWPLGNNLYTSNHNLTASIASVAPDLTIQGWTASFANFPNQNNYYSFTETYYADVANSGLANPVTDKIRIYSGSAYGTQLLPNKSIEIQPTIPVTKDIHILDASLSPQDEIDRAIIAAFGSTYNMDSIIGNPATGSYQQIQPLQVEFFKKFVNRYDYKDFIRLISFFHNSLFRTLKDFTPARTNLSTGIVIKPHLLERPVVYRYEPEFIDIGLSQSIDTAFISASNGGNYSQSLYGYTIEGKLGPVSMTSDARDFFTGVFPSGTLDTFVDQYNPFTSYQPTNTSSYSESIWYYDYNPLLNNVLDSRLSQYRQKVIYITSGSRLVQVFEPEALQDFTYEYQRHIRPRYIGSQVTSTAYTFYNNNDFDFYKRGLAPYGKNASIDKNTIQYAFFSEINCTGSFAIAMPERSNVYLKYLIDASGSLVELTQRDYTNIRNNQFWNLYQVQNIFPSTDYYGANTGSLNISLFDNQNPSGQKDLDGNHNIFAGGYKFVPTLWRVADTQQRYALPTGYSGDIYFVRGNYGADVNVRLITHYGWFETSFSGFIEYAPPGSPGSRTPLPYDVIVTLEIKVILGNSSFIDVLIPAQTSTGTPNYQGTFRYDRGGAVGYNGYSIVNIRPAAGNAPNLLFFADDASPSLIVNSTDKSIVSCSAAMSTYYNATMFMSSSTLTGITTVDPTLKIYNTYCPPDYPFQLTPGDIIRFDSGSSAIVSTFRDVNEYTILEVYPSGSSVAFKLDRPVLNILTSSATPYRIPRYVFSKRVPDETNVIINHLKKPGQTSAGIVKSLNLKLDIDDNVANIVSELKSKIFSTVLVP